MRNSSLKSIAFICLTAMVFAGCGLGKMVKKYPDVKYTVTPEVLEVHGGKVPVTISGTIPAKYFHKKATVAFTPTMKFEGGEAALKSITDQVIATANGMDLAAAIATPFGEMPAGQFIMTPMMDMVVHRWDLASATDQNSTIDSAIAEICIGILAPQFLEGARKNGAFGPEVVIPGRSRWEPSVRWRGRLG